MPDIPYWFADVDEDTEPGFPWRPYLQLHGMCIPLETISFSSKEQCEDFIRTDVLKAREIDAT